MITFELFLIGLLFSSTATSLVTEGIKKILIENKITYRANTLAGVVAILVSAAVGAGYVITNLIVINASTVIGLIAFIIASWLCAMVGYDKVVQTISQFKTNNKESVSR